jgi:hypothetical protein
MATLSVKCYGVLLFLSITPVQRSDDKALISPYFCAKVSGWLQSSFKNGRIKAECLRYAWAQLIKHHTMKTRREMKV